MNAVYMAYALGLGILSLCTVYTVFGFFKSKRDLVEVSRHEKKT